MKLSYDPAINYEGKKIRFKGTGGYERTFVMWLPQKFVTKDQDFIYRYDFGGMMYISHSKDWEIEDEIFEIGKTYRKLCTDLHVKVVERDNNLHKALGWAWYIDRPNDKFGTSVIDSYRFEWKETEAP